MKLLDAVFSYNRYYYLKNTIDSRKEFSNWGEELLVVDDGSDDPVLIDYLDQLEAEGVKVIRQKRYLQEMYIYMRGCFYENHDIAINYAIENGYDYIRFIEDDVQYMWHNPDYLTEIQSIFDHFNDAIQVMDFFPNGLKRTRMFEWHQLRPEANCYYHYPYGMCTLGITKIEPFKKFRFRYGNGRERTNADWWRRRDYKAYALHSPTMCQVPWPKVIQSRKTVEEGRMPINKYFMRPLTQSEIKHLRGRSLKKLPFVEEYCQPWGWSCKKPYCYSNPDAYYLALKEERRNNIIRFAKGVLGENLFAHAKKAYRKLKKQ